MSEFFGKESECPEHEIFPGVRIRTSWLTRVMTSVVRFEPGAIVEEHSHPHEQMGVIVSGRCEFTIGGETRVLGPGDLYKIPGDVRHRVVALEEGTVAFDVFAPVREEYQ